MSKELERLEEEKLRLIKKLEGNDSIFDRQYINLKIENINLQMQVYNLMQPAVQKLMLSSPKILVIQNDKTIGYIENELLEKVEKYDDLTTPPTEQEVWKSIKGHDEKYMVSNYGRVKSLNRLVKKRGGQRIVKEKFLNININNKGYCQVSLTTKHKSKLHFIHRLVAEAFIPNQENKPNVNHKDFNPYNNCVKNLEWCTQKENVKHAIDNGKYENVFKVANQPKPKGFNNHLRKNIVQLDINGNFIKEWEGIKNASKHFKTNDANIIKVCKGKQHTAGGFKWKYADEFYEGKVKE